MAKTGYAGPFDEVSFYIGRVYYDHLRLLEQLIREAGLAEHLGLGMGQILFTLFEKDNVIIKDLTRRLRLSPSHLTSVLEKMEKAGVIVRSRDRGDGRAVRIGLTEFGNSMKEKCRGVLGKLNRVMTKGISADEVAIIKNQLELMVNNIKAYRKSEKTKK